MYFNIGPSKKDLYKIIFILFLIMYLLFVGRNFVSASAYYGTGTNPNNLFPYNSYIGTGAGTNRSMKFTDNIIYSTSLDVPSYFKFTFCSDTTFYNWSLYNNTNNSGSVRMYKTNSTCNFPNSSYAGGRLVYIWGKTNLTANCSSSLTNCQNVAILQYSDAYASWYLLNEEWNSTGFQLSFDSSQSDQYSQSINNNTYNSYIEQQETNNILNDSSIDQNSASDLTSNSAFQDQNGLQAIIQAPLNFIQSLTSTTCNNISLTIPFIDADVSLPCMSSVYNKALGQQLVNLIALVINGVVLYRYCLKILQIVKDAKNPNKDGLEVLDL